MEPINFEEANLILNKPEDMTDEECGPMHIFGDGKTCISCWELSPDEVKKILKTSKIYVGVHSGKSQPPIFLTVEPPFIREDVVEIQPSSE